MEEKILYMIRLSLLAQTLLQAHKYDSSCILQHHHLIRLFIGADGGETHHESRAEQPVPRQGRESD